MAGGAIFHRKQQSLSVGQLYQAHALAEIRRLEVMALLNSLGVEERPIPEYPVELFDDDPEKIARSVRAAMNIPPGPIFNLTEILERNGCVVVAHDFNSRQIDGFSQRPMYGPCFLHLNSQLPPDRWRWTLAHELAHVVMHDDPMAHPKLVEEQADRFAAEFLAPGHEIAPLLSGLTFQKLGGLKREWKISMQALITRAYHLGTITDRQRRSMYVRLSKAGYRIREPETLDPPVEKPGKMAQLAQSHLDELEYGRTELGDLLAIGDEDFRKNYIPSDDIIGVLGLGRYSELMGGLNVFKSLLQKLNKPGGNFPMTPDIRMMGVDSDNVATPKNDGSRGSALYNVPIKLSDAPDSRGENCS